MSGSSALPAPGVQTAGSGGRIGNGVPVALALADHGHEWQRDDEMSGLFHCADLGCDAHAVCPGCLHSINVAHRASAAGLVVYWCVLHVRGGRRGRGRAAR